MLHITLATQLSRQTTPLSRAAVCACASTVSAATGSGSAGQQPAWGLREQDTLCRMQSQTIASAMAAQSQLRPTPSVPSAPMEAAAPPSANSAKRRVVLQAGSWNAKTQKQRLLLARSFTHHHSGAHE